MSTGITVFLTILMVIFMGVTVSAFSKRPDSAWNYYHFDGRSFISGPSTNDTPFLAVRDAILPVILTHPTKIEATAMPAEKGAIAGICYIESSGGEPADGQQRYIPAPGMLVTLLADDTVVLKTQTNEYGYFIAVLPAGVYRISSGVFSVQARVEVGTTTLSRLRTGKRMVN